MNNIISNFQKKQKINKDKLLNSLKSYYIDKPLKTPFSKKNIDEIHKIISTYFNVNLNDLEIIIHEKKGDNPYFFCVLTNLDSITKNEIKKILEIITNVKWDHMTLGCGFDGMKYCYYIS